LRHEEWVRTNLEKWSKSLGFRYTPREEIELRLDKVREGMSRKGIEALLVIQKMDYFYLSGTTQDALLFVPLDGHPLLMVKRELERAKVDSPLPHVVGFSSPHELPAIIGDHWGRLPETMGLEFDVLPVKEYLTYGELFPRSRLVDSSSIIRHARKIKTTFEVEMMRKAGQISRRVFEEARGFIREGITEIEVGVLMGLIPSSFGGGWWIALSHFAARPAVGGAVVIVRCRHAEASAERVLMPAPT
jgi:Xaa-Pro aminopeptidase